MNHRQKEGPIREAINSAPKTLYLFLFGILILGFGWGLDMIGIKAGSGLAGAFAIFLMAIAVIMQILISAAGYLD